MDIKQCNDREMKQEHVQIIAVAAVSFATRSPVLQVHSHQKKGFHGLDMEFINICKPLFWHSEYSF